MCMTLPSQNVVWSLWRSIDVVAHWLAATPPGVAVADGERTSEDSCDFQQTFRYLLHPREAKLALVILDP